MFSHTISADVKVNTAAVNKRIKEIIKIRKVIQTILFPSNTPVIVQIISEFSQFTDGLENLKEI